jgi:RNA recognition motif-containing protein
VKDDTLRDAFSKFGRIVDCRIARTGTVSRGFGFATFDDPRDAEDAMERYLVDDIET